MMSQDWGDAGTQEFAGTRMNGWQQYYGAAGYVAPADPAEWTDEILATHLGVEPRDLADAGIGTTFLRVRGVQASFEATDTLSDLDTWFAHGDPWHVLIGVGPARIVVGSVDMFEGGYAGPPTLTCRNPTSFPRAGADVAAIADAVLRSRRATARRMRRCPLCDSPRYGSGCRCDDLAYGIIYD